MANWQELLRGAPPEHRLNREQISHIEAELQERRAFAPWVTDLLQKSLGEVNPQSRVLLLACGIKGTEFPPVRKFFTDHATIYGFDTGFKDNQKSFHGNMLAYENRVQVSSTDIHDPLKALRSVAPFRPTHFLLRNPPIEIFASNGDVHIDPRWLRTIQGWGQYARNMKAAMLITTLTEQGIHLIEQTLHVGRVQTTGPQVFDQGTEIPPTAFPQTLKLDNFYTVIRP